MPAENAETAANQNRTEAEQAGAVACAASASDTDCGQALTGFLHTHRLPLVGAQVVKVKQGKRQVMLYGFTGTLQGKSDAEDNARYFINDPNALVVNRVKVDPELARTSRPIQPAQPPPEQNYESPDLQAYQQQQIRQYQQQQMNPWGGPTFGFGSGFGGGWGGGWGSGFGMGFGPSPMFPSPFYSPSPFFWP